MKWIQIKNDELLLPQALWTISKCPPRSSQLYQTLQFINHTQNKLDNTIYDTHKWSKINKKQFFFPLFPFKSLFTNLSSSFSFQIISRRSAEHFHSNDHKTLLFVSTRVKMKNKTDTGFIYTLRGKTKHFVRLFLSSRFDGNHGSTSV